MLHDSEVVTLRKLRQKLLTEHDIEISKVSLWRQLRSLDFKFRKLKGGTSVICETSRLVANDEGKIFKNNKNIPGGGV